MIILEPAWDFIIRKADELQGDLTIVTLGALTNLAKALMIDPRLPYKVKSVVAMGGCINKPGNVTPYAEANFYDDAKAADLVVRAGFPMMLVSLDVTTETFITAEDLNKLRKYCAEENLPMVQYMQDALAFYFRFLYNTAGSLDRCIVHDPLAMVLAEDPSLGEYRFIRAGVEYEHSEYRGMIKSDDRFMSTFDQEEILYCSKVNSDAAVRKIFSVLR